MDDPAAHPLARMLEDAASGRFPVPDGGVDVLTTYKQTVSYGDFVAGVNDYRILVDYSVSQGF